MNNTPGRRFRSAAASSAIAIVLLALPLRGQNQSNPDRPNQGQGNSQGQGQMPPGANLSPEERLEQTRKLIEKQSLEVINATGEVAPEQYGEFEKAIVKHFASAFKYRAEKMMLRQKKAGREAMGNVIEKEIKLRKDTDKTVKAIIAKEPYKNYIKIMNKVSPMPQMPAAPGGGGGRDGGGDGGGGRGGD